MHKLIKTILIALTVMICSLVQSELKADCDHSLSSARNNLTPMVRFVVTPRFCGDILAVSFLGEVGEKINRINGTLGVALTNSTRVKIGGEYLNEKLRYSFLSGRADRWMNQYAVGGAYQYVIDCNYLYSFDLTGRYSYAPSRELSDFACAENLLLNRRVAGSTAWGMSAGFTIIPWSCAALNLAAVYDHVDYQVKYDNTRKKEHGAGGSIALTQQITSELFLNLKSEFRRPYSYYEGQLKWVSCLRCGTLSIGIFGGRVEGRHDLPSSITGGIEFGFDFGIEQVCIPANFTCSIDRRDESCCSENGDFLGWLAIPAVYMPQILAVADQQLNEFCIAPTSTEIPDQEFDVGDVFTLNLAPFFNGHGSALTYSSNLNLNIDVDGGNVYVDPTTGQLYALGLTSGFMRVTITATSSCGITSQTLDILVNDDEETF